MDILYSVYIKIFLNKEITIILDIIINYMNIYEMHRHIYEQFNFSDYSLILF